MQGLFGKFSQLFYPNKLVEVIPLLFFIASEPTISLLESKLRDNFFRAKVIRGTMVIITDDYENQKGVSHVSSAVTDPLDSETPEMSQNLNAGIEEKSVDEDPEAVESSSKKKKKLKNRGRKNTDRRGSSSQNTDKFPQFDLNDYPSAGNHDLNMMTLLNDYNRRNHAVISGRESGGFDKQMDNLSDVLWSVCQMLRAETRCGTPDSSSSSNNNHNDDSSSNNNHNDESSNNNKKKKIWCPRCHQLTRRCRCP